jgi:uncharacterized cupredoxin-like copper-binding protein
MNRKVSFGSRGALLAPLALMIAIALAGTGAAHEEHAVFSAGEPGDPTKPARLVNVKMFVDGKQKLFTPSRIEVRRGEQIRFILENDDADDHEFVLATAADNQNHAEQMKKFPDMDHNTPNAKRVRPFQNGELLWQFTRRGEFEFACLISGHYEAGMHGQISVR